MKIIEKIKEQWEDVKSWVLRNSIALLIATTMLFMLKFKYLYFEVIAGIMLFATVTVLISGYVLWVFTKINFVQAGDNRAVTEIFKGVCFITAAILIGFYFVFAKP